MYHFFLLAVVSLCNFSQEWELIELDNFLQMLKSKLLQSFLSMKLTRLEEKGKTNLEEPMMKEQTH